MTLDSIPVLTEIKQAKDAPAFDFYPERWSQGTRHMSKVERCDYLDLLAFQWSNDGVPDDLAAVARILGYKKASQIPAAVLEKFPLAADGKRRNARLETIREEQRRRITKRREGAAITNARRWSGARSSGAAGDSLAGRSATLERPGSDIASESPPPTTHHPPREDPSLRTARPTLAQAQAVSGQAGVTEAEAGEWWHAREASGWMRGTAGGGTLPVGENWQADLKAYTNRARERRAHAAAKGRASPAGGAGAAVDSARPVRF